MTFIQEKQKEARKQLGNPMDWSDRDGITEPAELQKYQELVDSIIATTIQDTVKKIEKELGIDGHEHGWGVGYKENIKTTDLIQILTRLSKDI